MDARGKEQDSTGVVEVAECLEVVADEDGDVCEMMKDLMAMEEGGVTQGPGQSQKLPRTGTMMKLLG